MIFTPIGREEFQRLTLEQRMEYLRRAMADLRRETEQTKQLEYLRRAMDDLRREREETKQQQVEKTQKPVDDV